MPTDIYIRFQGGDSSKDLKRGFQIHCFSVSIATEQADKDRFVGKEHTYDTDLYFDESNKVENVVDSLLW